MHVRFLEKPCSEGPPPSSDPSRLPGFKGFQKLDVIDQPALQSNHREQEVSVDRLRRVMEKHRPKVEIKEVKFENRSDRIAR